MCPNCAAGGCVLDLIRSACTYDDASRGAVLPFKHAGRVNYATFMARAMIWAMRDVEISPDIVMPVPLAYGRLFHRGYNQSTLLARPIANAFGNAFRKALIPISSAGSCSGAYSAKESIFAITSSSIMAESLKYSPPATTR